MQHRTRAIFPLFAGLVASVLLFIFAVPVDAAPRKGFEALQVSVPSGSDLQFAPGEVKKLSVSFLNIGSVEWKNDGVGYVSLYTYDPKYRKSTFDPGTWLSPSQVVRQKEVRVAPKGLATFSFELRAPKTSGTYKESFALVSEDTTWIPNGVFELSITVFDQTVVDPAAYRGAVIIRSAKQITAAGSAEVVFSAGVQNTGTTAWKVRAVKTPDLTMATATSVVHASWIDASTALQKTGGELAAGAMEFLEFRFRAPSKVGNYTLTFRVVADDQVVEGADILIPVTVTSDAPEVFDAPLLTTPSVVVPTDGIADAVTIIPEPTLRIGILLVDEETANKVVIEGDADGWTLVDTNGVMLAGPLPKTQKVLAQFRGGVYEFDAGAGTQTSREPLRFVPAQLNGVMTITNFDRRATRGSQNADNQFRNILELRYNTSRNRAWVINELPIEMYLRGLAETFNNAPAEHLKTMTTAARSYAKYQSERNTKHTKEGFMLDAYVDQVYKGYGQELRMPNLVQATEDTYGVVATYQGATAITPYFARSDGYTRSWLEVWKKEIPYLQRTAVPCDIGKALWGHGVGMSASGAYCMAEGGVTYKDILLTFYKEIELKHAWKKF